MNDQATIEIRTGEAQAIRRGALTLREFAAGRLEEQGDQGAREEEHAAAQLAQVIGEAEGPITVKAPAEVIEGSLHHTLFDLAAELMDLIEQGPEPSFPRISEKAEQIARIATDAEEVRS
jgi:hypothetical protein